MFPQYGYMPGPDYGPSQGQMPVDPSATPGRFDYSAYYSHKGQPASHYGGMAAAAGHPYGGKPRNMTGADAMYVQNWSQMMQGQGYIGAPGSKAGMANPYSMQVDMYGGVPPPHNQPGYPESLPPHGLGGYHPSASYSGPPHQYPSRGQYPPYGGSHSRGVPPPPPHPSMMQGSSTQGASTSSQEMRNATPGAAPSMDGYQGNVPHNMQYPQGHPPSSAGAMSRAWAGGQNSSQSQAGWPPGSYRSPEDFRSSTPGQQQQASQPGGGGGGEGGKNPQSSSIHQQSLHTPVSQPQLLKQSSQSSFSARSPQTPYSNPPELTKQGSISSLREALAAPNPPSVGPPPQQQQAQLQHMPSIPYNSPRMASVDHQPSPSANVAHTPETGVGTPATASSVLSPQQMQGPSPQQPQDPQQLTSARSDPELAQTFTAAAQHQMMPSNNLRTGGGGGDNRGVSPFQVESILGIKNDKPIDAVPTIVRMPSSTGLQHQTSLTNSVGSAVQSPRDASHVDPFPAAGGGMMNSQDAQQVNAVRRPDSLGYMSPYAESQSPATADKNLKTPVLSPVNRNHPSIMDQYQYSGEHKRKEFLDTLFAYLEKEGVPLLRLPMICKAPLDLYQAFNTVQQLGGFTNVMEKRLWRDVLKAVSNGAANPNSGALRTLQQYYMKVLLPYECHIKNLDISKLENSMSLHSSIGSPGSQVSATENERINHYPHMAPSVESNSVESLRNMRVNGESEDHPGKIATPSSSRSEQRLNSQGSDSGPMNSGGESQLSSGNATPDGPMALSQQKSAVGIEPPSSQQPQRGAGASLDIPEGSQNSVDTYSQVITEPLPEMSVQDAESVLGMSPAPYPNQQQQPPGGPATPSAIQNAPSPSPSHYPPHFPHHPPSVTPGGAPPPGTPGAPATPADYMDVNEMGRSSTPGMTPNPPMYPPSYPMDPMSAGGYPHHHQSQQQHHSMPPGYHQPPYNAAPSPHGHQYDMQQDYHHHPHHRSTRMHPSSLMRQPYVNGSPHHYPGMSPSMAAMHGHMPPSMEYAAGYRPSVMSPHAAAAMGGMRDIPPYPGPPSMGPDWHWNQQRSRVLAPLPAHLHSSSGAYQRRQQLIAAMHQHHSASHRGSPGASQSGSDPIKIHWEQQNKSSSPLHVNKIQEKTSAMPKQSLVHKSDATAPENKTISSRTMEQAEILKRSLPDWSNCVEGTKPNLVKRRRLFSGDCGHVEPWRVMMSLKSGLLAESTWALDTLNILLHDDRTVGFFYLKHHHSLLNTVVDHFKVTLESIFGLKFDDLATYLPDHQGSSPGPRTVEGEKENSEKYSTEWLSNSTHTDYDILNNRGNSKSNSEEKSSSESSIPVANVFDSSLMKLGKSDHLSHIHIPVADENLFFPEAECDMDVMPEKKRKELENVCRLQRIDQTPVSFLLQREALLSQIPLHRFGRLSRSPRRREKSFLEEMRRRESLSRMEEDKSSTAGSSKPPSTPMADRTSSNVGGQVSKQSVSEDVFSSPEILPKGSPEFLREESEIHRKEGLPLWSVSPVREQMQRRCMCISNILRSLSFIPGNDIEFSQHPNILIVLGQLLMLHHNHLISSKRRTSSHLSPTTKSTGSISSSPPSSKEKDSAVKHDSPAKHEEQQFKPFTDFWWWDCIEMLQENTLVILSNISGQLDLSVFPEIITFPIVKGLLHWCVCPSAHATDPLPDTAMVSSLSPQRLVIETLAKVSISEVNVDFILATPPLPQLDLLFARLGEFMGQKKHPVMRQFSLVLLSNLCQGSEIASRIIGQQKMIVSLLLECIEVAEHTACVSSGRMVGGYNPEDPNSLSVAMLRRAATTLHCLSKVPANRTSFLPYHDRMLYLATSQYVEPSVSSILMDVMFEFGKL